MTKKSKNQLTKGEISQYAREFLDALKSEEKPEEFTQRFSAETASARRDVLEAVRERIKSTPGSKYEAERIAKLLRQVMDAGSAQKPDFIEGYFRAVFACAIALAGEKVDLPCKILFTGLLSSTVTKESGTADRLVNTGTMSALASSVGVVRGLDAALSDQALHQILNESFDVWSIIIPELAARGRDRIGLSAAALSGLLKVIAGRPSLDSSIRLSLPVIVGSVGIVPEEFKVSQHANSELAIRESALSGAGTMVKAESSGLTVTPVPADVPQAAQAIFSNKDISRCSDSILKLLKELDASTGDRLKNLGDEIIRIQKSHADVSNQLVKCREENSSLNLQKNRFKEQIDQNKSDFADLNVELAKVKDELDQYSNSHAVQVKAAANIEQDVANRIKREFGEQAGATLKDIRSYLELLLKAANIEQAKFAVSSFNRLAKILQNQHYMPANSLPKIEVIVQASDKA